MTIIKQHIGCLLMYSMNVDFYMSKSPFNHFIYFSRTVIKLSGSASTVDIGLESPEAFTHIDARCILATGCNKR